MRGPRPHQGLDPRESSGRPRWAPIEGSGGRTKQFKGAPRWDYFWKVGIDIFWPTRAVEWGFSNNES